MLPDMLLPLSTPGTLTMQTNFSYLLPAFTSIADPAVRAEALAIVDPRGACFYARRTLEVLVNHLYDTDTAFQRPWETHLASLLAAPCFATRGEHST